MTKIFSAVFFAILLIGTWSVIQNRPAVTYQTHSDMQATMVQLITTQLRKEKPEMRDFQILDLKSENLSDNAVRVSFKYQFEEPDVNGTYAKVQKKGSAELMRAASQQPDAPEVWQLRVGKVLTDLSLIITDEQRVDPSIPEGADPEPAKTMPSGATATTGVPAPTGTPLGVPAPTGTPTPASQ